MQGRGKDEWDIRPGQQSPRGGVWLTKRIFLMKKFLFSALNKFKILQKNEGKFIEKLRFF